MVEHLLAKEGVAGSIPVSRSFYSRKLFVLKNLRIFYICELFGNTIYKIEEAGCYAVSEMAERERRKDLC